MVILVTIWSHLAHLDEQQANNNAREEIWRQIVEFESSLEKVFRKEFPSVAKENIQPRIRMTALMAYSNASGKLLLNTSNKSEIATGFATLYGDSSGALAS